MNDTLDLFDEPQVGDDLPPPPPPVVVEEDLGDHLPLDQFAERAYLAYAMSVVRGRALPQVEDGMKPVQRRILFAMHEMRLGASARHVKSARVVGDVIGKYHPHGDSSVYEAAVRMAQSFTLRYPLVDGQGNFGSRDGDSAAAMRYTEARLTPIAELLLGEIDRGTVDFIPNYDGAFFEPQLLPARLPFVLLNGASGIAVGMATEIPPHNLTEIAQAAQLLIKKPETSLEELMAIVPGPDFPGGGQIISGPSVLRDAYAAGRGSIRMRARWRREDLARGQWRIIITEFPHGVSAAQVLSEIEALTNPQPRTGKKEVSADQKTLKAQVLGVLESVRDESSDKEPVRLMLEPRSSRMSPEEFMAVLLAHTSLETNVAMNFTMIGRDGRPQQKNLRQIVVEWIDFRFVTVGRRTQHRLDEVDKRIHILEGRMIVFLRIEDVIRVIREADDPKAELIAAFGLTDIQAEDILEIRLRQLARLEGIRIEKELNELRDERGALQTLLDDKREMTKLILKEISEDAKKFGDKRRTLIEAVASIAPAEIAVPDEPVTVVLSKNGWVRARQGHGLDAATLTYKTGDFPMLVMESRTVWPLVLVDTRGRAYSVRVSDLPGGRGDGVPITTMIDLQDGAKIACAITAAPETQYLFANSGGYGFIAKVADLVTRQKAGKAFMSLESNEAVLTPARVAGNSIACVSENARLLVFPIEEMKVQSGGRGVIAMALEKGETLVAVTVNDGTRAEIEGAGRGGKAKTVSVGPREMEKYRLHRARKGCLLSEKIKPTAVR